MKKNNSLRVFRGGSWSYGARGARVAARNWYIPILRSGNLGFRLARIVNPLEQLSEMFDEQR